MRIHETYEDYLKTLVLPEPQTNTLEGLQRAVADIRARELRKALKHMPVKHELYEIETTESILRRFAKASYRGVRETDQGPIIKERYGDYYTIIIHT